MTAHSAEHTFAFVESSRLRCSLQATVQPEGVLVRTALTTSLIARFD